LLPNAAELWQLGEQEDAEMGEADLAGPAAMAAADRARIHSQDFHCLCLDQANRDRRR
jgi:hypothetical protein